MSLTLGYDFFFKDLYTWEGLKKLDHVFENFMPSELFKRWKDAKEQGLCDDDLLIDCAIVLEEFLSCLFPIQEEVQNLQKQHGDLEPLYRCKRIFVQRQAMRAFHVRETAEWDFRDLEKTVEIYLGQPFEELAFAEAVLIWMDQGFPEEAIDAALRYSAWRCYHSPHRHPFQPGPSILFDLPQRIQEDSQICNSLRKHHTINVLEKDEFLIPDLERRAALGQGHYCLFCHRQGKDFCKKGLPGRVDRSGCPLGQKVSQMNLLRAEGFCLGALAVIMIDNPLVAATGYRICQDCSASCIFQKQTPVNVPLVETQTLLEVLNLPWGFEIYSLLSRWNPLNFQRLSPPSGYNVCIVGQGPAGLALAHHLLQKGHHVLALDGLRIAPCDVDFQPIFRVQDLWAAPERGDGFGGVMAYGITDRWDKNMLSLVRIVLERCEGYALFGGVRLGSTLTVNDLFERGFDHVALCLGAGQPQIPILPGLEGGGVYVAAHFLMALQMGKVFLENSLASFPVRLPAVVIGGGLTAIDVATEVLNYYPVMVERLLKAFEKGIGDFSSSLAQEFLNHGRVLRAERAEALSQNRSARIKDILQSWGGVTILYRQTWTQSPAYRENAFEVSAALGAGVFLAENKIVKDVLLDETGLVLGVNIEGEETIFPCRTIFIATGTDWKRHDADITVDPVLLESQRLSVWGEQDPMYRGSVVKAMASGKEGARVIHNRLQKAPPLRSADTDLKKDLDVRVHQVIPLNETMIHLVIFAPQAAKKFQPGHIFRLQSLENRDFWRGEPIAVTGVEADPESGRLSFIIQSKGASSYLVTKLQPGDRLSLMGPAGAAYPIWEHKVCLLIGFDSGIGNLLSFAQALKNKGNYVILWGHFSHIETVFSLETFSCSWDEVLLSCCPGGSDRMSGPSELVMADVPGILATKSQAWADVTSLMIQGPLSILEFFSSQYKRFFPNCEVALANHPSWMQCMMKGMCGCCLQFSKRPGEEIFYACAKPYGLLDEMVLPSLGKLSLNKIMERVLDDTVRKNDGY